MKKENFIAVIKFLFLNKVRNYVNSVNCGMGPHGVEALLDDLKKLSTSDLLSVIGMQDKISRVSFEKAVELFLKEPGALCPESLENQKKIVTALGFEKVYHLFSDGYFHGKGIEAVRNIFAALSPKDRQLKMTAGLFRYYGEKSAVAWEMSPEIMEFLAARFVECYQHYGSAAPELIEYLTDGYGLNLAYDKCVNERSKDYTLLAQIMDYASESGIAEFLRNYADVMSVKALQTTLFLEEKKTLPVVVKTVGCASPEIERNLLFNRILPEESICVSFCFPQNFSLLMETFGAEQVALLFPDGCKKSCPCLWNWVLTHREPLKIDRTECSGYEWQFVLADDKLCSQYINQGGKLDKQDVMTLLNYGKDNLIKLYREKK